MTATRRTALIVRGGWDGHQPVQTTDHFAGLLAQAGFDTRISEDTTPYADTDYLAGVDLIVQCITGGEITAEEMAGLTGAVRNGTGLAGWHGGITGSFPGQTDFTLLTGGVFAAHPPLPQAERLPEADPSFVPHRINITAAGREHTITRGVDDFDLTTEQYWVLTDAYMDVLATATRIVRPGDPWHEPVEAPVVWTRHWGAGKVFVATPGHDIETVQLPPVETIIQRGLLWASR